MSKKKKKKKKTIFDSIRKQLAPPTKKFDTSKKSKRAKPKHKKPIEIDVDIGYN